MRQPFLTVASALFFFLSGAAVYSDVLYYNDGTVNDFDETFGDIEVDVPWNHVFEPGGWRDGTPDDVPPFNQIDNLGIITKRGLAGGVDGGGFRKAIPLRGVGGGAPPRTGPAVVVTYGSVSSQKGQIAGSWALKFENLGRQLGVSSQQAINMWRNGLMMDGRLVKLLVYTGDPMISPPPTDVTQSQLDPIDLPAVQAALATDHMHVIFWEVEGPHEMETLDLLMGDFEVGRGYANLEHHYPMVAVLGDVGPADFGIPEEEAFITVYNGSGLGGDFTGNIQIVSTDPVPEPATILLLCLCLLLLTGCRRGR